MDSIATIRLNNGFELFDYQQDADRWLEKREGKGAILCLKMGLGKTLMTLYQVAKDVLKQKATGIKKMTLVICSKTIVGEWTNDLEKFFGQHSQIKTLIWHADYTPAGQTKIGYQKYLNNMTQTEMEKYDLVITTYEVCSKSAKSGNTGERIVVRGESGIHEGKIVAYAQPKVSDIRPGKVGADLLHHYHWSRIATDESQTFCNAKTKTFLAVASLIGDTKLCLTGTPVRNGDSDIWSLLFFCGYTAIDNPRKWKYENYTPEIQDMVLTIEYNEKTVKIPEKQVMVHELELGEVEKKIYANYFLKLFDEYNKFINGNEEEKSFAMILALFTRLRQICIAPFLMSQECKKMVYQKDGDEETTTALDNEDDAEMQSLASAIRDANITGFGAVKMNYVLALVIHLINHLGEDGKPNNVLVFSAFSSVLRLMCIYFDHFKIKYQFVDGQVTGSKRQERMNAFRRGECQILLMNYKVGAQGLNLTQANHVINIEPWWSPVLESQAASRAHRNGQTRVVTVHRILVKGTIEMQINKIGAAKESIGDSYLDTSKAGDRKDIPGLDKYTLGQILSEAYRDIKMA